MATIKYKDENGNLVTVGAGLHTHSPSDIGAAIEGHGHDVATDKAAGFLSATDKAALDATIGTVNKLDNWIGDKAVQDQISEAVDTRVEKVTGKGLSTNDYTTAEKTKLANIEAYANNYELPTAAKDVLGGVKTTSTVTSSSGYTACPIVSGVPYYKNTNTQNTAGSSNTSSKIYLVGATSQATSATTYSHDTVYVDTDGCLYSNSKKVSTEGHTHPVDETLSSTSTNPVQNKVIDAINTKFTNLIGPDPVNEQISSAITSATINIENVANKYTDDKIAELINSAPSTLDTLGEIATAMKANEEVVIALDQAIGNRALKEHPHVSADITDFDTRLASRVPTTRTVNGKALSANITLLPSDVGAATEDHTHLGLYYTQSDIDNQFATLVSNIPVSEQISDHADNMASNTAPGHMSKEDKIRLDGLFNYTHPDKHDASMINGLSTVATSGSYNDLINKPTIPAAYTHPKYTAKSSGLYKITVDDVGHVSGVTAVQQSDITNLGIPSNNTIDDKFTTFIGEEPVSEQISSHATTIASSTSAGHMSAGDKSKLDGIDTGANKYIHPSYTAKTSGLYKVTVDSTGHVSGTTVVQKSDITALGIPSSDTVYTHPTTAGNKHIPSGGSSGQVLGWSASGTATWVTPRFLPSVTTSNNGQFLRVVNGAWTAVTIKTAESEAL